MEEKLHFKLTTNYTFKDFVETNKSANWLAISGGRLSIVIFQLFYLYNYSKRNVEAFDLFFIEGVVMCFKDPLYLLMIAILCLFWWKIPEFITWVQIMHSDKKQTSKTITRTYTFYDTYLTILTHDSREAESNDSSEVVIRYSYIYKLYESKNLYILKTYSMKSIPIPKRLLNSDEVSSFENFINIALEKSKKKQDVQ